MIYHFPVAAASKLEVVFLSGCRCCYRGFLMTYGSLTVTQSILIIFKDGGSQPEAVFVTGFL